MSEYKLTVDYRGGSGIITTRESLLEILDRLHNIALLDGQGSVVVDRIKIERVES